MKYSNRVKIWRKNFKKKLVMCMGGKCNKCGYNYCYDALDFHHIKPNKKSFGIGQASANPKSWIKLIKEAKKCVLLCNRCHRELHSNLWSLNSIKIIKFKNKFKKQQINNKCYNCNKIINKKNKYCNKCYYLSVSKIPPKQELKKLIWEKPSTHIAKIYGVSDKAVEKWCKKYNITKPSRGYWAKVHSKKNND